jgi:poly(ADP-ribose) glycohydrolase ARH3
MRQGQDHREAAEELFPGGSFGNGAAMRVAPVGLLFHNDWDRVWEQARQSAMPTHVHPLAIEGAQLVALAVAIAVSGARIERLNLLAELRCRCQTAPFRDRLDMAGRIQSREELALLGNGVPALYSVVTAITCFAFSPDSFEDVLTDAIFLGGDTDTIAAMACAMSGARLGIDGVPRLLLDRVEDGKKGRTYVAELAARLSQVLG